MLDMVLRVGLINSHPVLSLWVEVFFVESAAIVQSGFAQGALRIPQKITRVCPVLAAP